MSQPESRLRKVVLFPLSRLLLAAFALAAALIARDVIANGLLGLRDPALHALLTVVILHAAYLGYVRLIERRRATEFALAPAAAELALGAAIGLGILLPVVGVLWLAGYLSVAAGAGLTSLLPLTVLTVQTAWIEEIAVRGVLFRILEEGLGSWIAIALSAGVFGALHLGNPDASLLGAITIAATAGLVLAAAYMLTRRLWMAIGLHFAVNWFQGPVLGLPVSGVERNGLLVSDLSGPDLLTGGAFGLEASVLLLLVGLLAAIELLRRAWRRGQFVAPLWSAGRTATGGGIFLANTGPDRAGPGADRDPANPEH